MEKNTIFILIGLAIAAAAMTAVAVYDPLKQYVVGTVPMGGKIVRVVSVPDAKGMLNA